MHARVTLEEGDQMDWPVFDTLEDVPELFRDVYEERDGKWASKPAGEELAGKGLAALENERAARATADKARKQAEKDLAAAKLALQQKAANATDDELKKLREMAQADARAEVAEVMAGKDAEIEALKPLQGENRDLKLDTKVKRIMMEAGVLPDRVTDLYALRMIEKDFDLTEDGKPKLVNHPGMAIDQYVLGPLKKQYPYHFKGSQGSGGGSGGAFDSDGKPVTGTTAEEIQANPAAAMTAARAAGS